MKFLNIEALLSIILISSDNSYGFTTPSTSSQHQFSNSISSSSLYSAVEEDVEKKVIKTRSIGDRDKMSFLKYQRDTIAKKPDYLRGAGAFKKVKKNVAADMKDQFDSTMMNTMKETPNFKLEKDGVEFYLAKDHGFCWGVERSINLAYSAVETFPDSQLHITNELIHNPMVNDRLHSKNVNFIVKDEDNNKDFSAIQEGDVVMLPAFGATLDEMKILDAKCEGGRYDVSLGRQGMEYSPYTPSARPNECDTRQVCTRRDHGY